jgi:hypothetical protein
MIYLFGKGRDISIIPDNELLTEQDKQGSITVETLPPVEQKFGYQPQLCLDDNNQPYWDYVKLDEELYKSFVKENFISKEQYKELFGKDFVV